MLLAGIVVVLATGAGIAVYTFRSRPPLPLPPEIHYEGPEPAVRTLLQAARERVLKDPRSAKAWGELGEKLIANEMDEDSRVCFVQAERLDPTNPRWPYYQAGTLINRGDREEALRLLERAVERAEAVGESNEVPRLLLAENLLALGRLDEAEAHFRHVQKRQPNDLRLHWGLGQLAAARQDWAASRDHLLLCLESPAAQKKASAKLAFVSLRLGQAAEAQQFREQADRLPRDREWSDPYTMLYMPYALKKRGRYRWADSLEEAGRLAEAAEVLRPLVQEFPEDYLTHLTLAKVLGRLGFLNEAEAGLRRALQLAPDKVQAHHYLGLVLFLEGEAADRAGERAGARERYEEAAAELRRALAIKGDYGIAHMCLGQTLKKLGQAAEGLASLRQAVHCNPEHAEIHYHLGEALAETGAAAEARDHLEQALRFGPSGASWRKAARERLAALGQGTEAGKGPPPEGKPIVPGR
jgi:tetratricopeptide (TPR) repeat protein